MALVYPPHGLDDAHFGGMPVRQRAAAANAGNSIPSTTMANAATVSADDYNAYAALMGTLAASAAASFQE